MTFRPAAVLVLTTTLLVLAGCSDAEPEAMPVEPSPAAISAEPSPEPSPSPSPIPSPSPLSPFEADPAVQAVRANNLATTEAINAGNLQLPALLAVSTARRQGRHADLFAEDRGTHFPGPAPLAMVGVRVVSPTEKAVAVCELDDGFALDQPGGTPTEPRLVVAGIYEMVLEGDVWKVDRAVLDEGRSCDGVPLPGDVG